MTITNLLDPSNSEHDLETSQRFLENYSPLDLQRPIFSWNGLSKMSSFSIHFQIFSTYCGWLRNPAPPAGWLKPKPNNGINHQLINLSTGDSDPDFATIHRMLSYHTVWSTQLVKRKTVVQPGHGTQIIRGGTFVWSLPCCTDRLRTWHCSTKPPNITRLISD